MLGDTQRRLVSVIFARQKSTNDLCHTRRRHFYWQARCSFRPVRGTQCCIGTLTLPTSPNVSVSHTRWKQPQWQTSRMPKWSFNAGGTKSLGHFRKFLTFSRPLIVAAGTRRRLIRSVVYSKRGCDRPCRRHMQLLFLYIHIICVRKYETFWCNLDTRHCHTFTAGQPVNFSTNPLVCRPRELHRCVVRPYL